MAEREELRGLFKVLSQDDTPMVRRAAAQSLGGIAEVVEQPILSRDIAPIFLKLTQDGEPWQYCPKDHVHTFISVTFIPCLEPCHEFCIGLFGKSLPDIPDGRTGHF